METNPTPFVIDSIRFVLESFGFLEDLESQISSLSIVDKEHTKIGCYYSFDLNSNDKSIIDPNDNSILCAGCNVYVDSIGLVADLTVWLREGKIDCLEVLSHTCDFPVNDPEKYYFKNIPVNYIDLT